MFTKIISGGQTGVDRAALDVALELGWPCGGWCPRGRRAEDGVLADRYPLVETPAPEYRQRTEWNVRDADGTLVLTRGLPRGGTRLTTRFAALLSKPCLVLDLNEMQSPSAVLEWAKAGGVKILNVAGPRESDNPGIYNQARMFLRDVLLTATSAGPRP